jgi:exopolyphosphatase/guanosine-5'-triphosphate,3'-diphosphate pyrophosphatase
VVAFIDMGTNSVRLLVVRLNPNISYTIISHEKEVIRLGERVRRPQPAPGGHGPGGPRVPEVRRLSRTYGADENHRVATSAAREAATRTAL